MRRVPSRSRTDRFGAPASSPGPDGKTHCARCLGCNVVLSRLPTRADASPALDNATVKLNVGRSGAAVFRGVTPDRGAVFVKMLCGVPGGYRQHENLGPTPETCKDADPTFPCPDTAGALGHGRCATAHLTAIDRVARDANLSRVSPSDDGRRRCEPSSPAATSTTPAARNSTTSPRRCSNPRAEYPCWNSSPADPVSTNARGR